MAPLMKQSLSDREKWRKIKEEKLGLYFQINVLNYNPLLIQERNVGRLKRQFLWSSTESGLRANTEIIEQLYS